MGCCAVIGEDAQVDLSYAGRKVLFYIIFGVLLAFSIVAFVLSMVFVGFVLLGVIVVYSLISLFSLRKIKGQEVTSVAVVDAEVVE